MNITISPEWSRNISVHFFHFVSLIMKQDFTYRFTVFVNCSIVMTFCVFSDSWVQSSKTAYTKNALSIERLRECLHCRFRFVCNVKDINPVNDLLIQTFKIFVARSFIHNASTAFTAKISQLLTSKLVIKFP